jgi:hypothetical protein
MTKSSRVVYGRRGPKSFKALAERVLDRCVLHLRGSFRARPKQKEKFLFEGPYFSGESKYETESAEFTITYLGYDGSGFPPRVRFKVYRDLVFTVEADPQFPKDALRCLDPAFNEIIELEMPNR